MTTLFVSSVDGDNADNGTTWSLAKQTVAGALAIASIGDVIKVDSAHNFNAGAAITWTPPGNIAIVSVNRAGSDAPLAGATESVGASSNTFTFTGVTGSIVVRGMTLNAGTNNSTNCRFAINPTAAVDCTWEFEGCNLAMNTQANAISAVNASGTSRALITTFRDCTFTNAGNRTGTWWNLLEGVTNVINCAVSITAGGPLTLFGATGTADVVNLNIRDSDLSGYNVSGGAYFGVGSLISGTVVIENCRLSATPSLQSGTWGGYGSLTLVNCDSGDTINAFEHYDAYGSLVENTSVYAAGGAEFEGSGISWLITTTSLCSEFTPFVVPDIRRRISSTSAQTATVELIRNNAVPLTDRDIALSISYPASASFPTYATANDRNSAPFTGTAADQATSSVSWTGAGGFANPTKQSLDVGFTAAEVGQLRGRVRIYKASETLYLSPRLTGVT